MNTRQWPDGRPVAQRAIHYRFPVAPEIVAEVAFVGKGPITADVLALTIETLQVMERAKRTDEEAQAPKAPAPPPPRHVRS